MKIPEFRIERYFANYEFNTPYLLCASDCQSFSVDEILSLEKGAHDQLLKLSLGYTETRGHPELLTAIAQQHEIITERDLITYSGGEEAVFVAMHALLDKGDHVIVQHPSYQSLHEIARSIGCEVTNWPMHYSNDWQPDLEFLADHIQPNTKLVVVNNPHNPTGFIMGKPMQQALFHILDKHGVYLFSDEIYRMSEYKLGDRLPIAADSYPKALSMGAVSKAYGLPGLRIGWVATQDQPTLSRMAQIKDYTTICGSAPSEFLATVALRNAQHLLSRNLSIIEDNLRALDQFFGNQRTLEWVRPKAGPVALVKKNATQPMDEFAADLRTTRGVLILPSHIFDITNDYFRLGFGRKNMKEALGLLEKFLNLNN